MTNPYAASAAVLDAPEATGDTYEPRIFALNGRIGRLRYLAYTWLYTLLLGVPIGILLGMALEAMQASESVFDMATSIAAAPILFIVARRRLQDLDVSGWVALLAVVPFINGIFGLYLLFRGGTEGPNSYGPAPSPNPRALKVVGLIIPVLFVGGIIAAIAIPAYQGYVKRAAGTSAQQAR